VKGDEVVLAEEEIDLGGVEFFGAGEVHRVHDEEQIVVVILELGEGAGGDAVLDGERVKLKDIAEDEFDFRLGGVFEIDPEDEALVGAHDAEGFDFEATPDEFAVAENEGVDHAARRRIARGGGAASPRWRISTGQAGGRFRRG